MSIKEQPDDGILKPIEVTFERGEVSGPAGRIGIEVVSLAIDDDADQGNDPYNQTGRFISLALKDKAFD